MAFPTVVATNTSAPAAIVSSHTVALPASIASGDLLIVLFRTGGASVTHTTPTNWNLLDTRTSTGRTSIFWKIATGSEGASVSITTSAGRFAVSHSYRITGHHPSTPIDGAFTAADSIDPPQVSHGWGAVDVLWLTLANTRQTNNTFTAPTNYTNQINARTTSDASTSTNDIRMSSARRSLASAAEDPASWGSTGTLSIPHSATIAIRPEPTTNTIDGSFIADAVLYSDIAVAGSFTAASVLLRSEAFTFTANSHLLRIESQSFAADAVLSTPVDQVTESFTADSVLYVPPTAHSATFTANAVIIRTFISEDFDSGLGGFTWSAFGSPPTGTGAIDGLLQTPSGVTASWRHADNLNPRAYVRFDIKIPDTPDLGSRYWQVNYGRRRIVLSMDNGSPQLWVSVDQSPSYSMTPTAGTWYRVFATASNTISSQLEVWIWPRSEPIPDLPNFTRFYSSAAGQFYINTEVFAWTSVQTPTPEPTVYDNFFGYSFDGFERRSTFTANAVIFRTYPGSLTANSVLHDPNVDTIDGSFTADGLQKVEHTTGGTTVGTSYTGTAVTVTNATQITVTYGGNSLYNNHAIVSLSIDTKGEALEVTPPAGWGLLKRTDTSDLEHSLITYIRKTVPSGEPTTATFSWLGNRDVKAVAYGVFPHQQPADVHLHWDIYDKVEDSQFGGILVVDDVIRPPRTGWASYAIAAAPANSTFTISRLPSGTMGSIGGTAQTPNASMAIRYNDYQPSSQDPYNYNVQFGQFVPLLTQLVIVYLEETVFTADAQLFNNALITFKADAFLELPFKQFTANAVLSRTHAKTFTANARLVTVGYGSLTANAVLAVPAQEGRDQLIFTANAVLEYQPWSPAYVRPRLSKVVNMSVLQRRPVDLGVFIAPEIPDEDEEEKRDKRTPPDCLPPCPPVGAGGGVNGWGSFKVSITKCSFCNNYFRSDSEFLGQGSAAVASYEHCGYCGDHQRDNHVTRLWVQYPSIPTGWFNMRAKLTWHMNGPDHISVRVFNVPFFPDTEEDGCEDSSFDWSGGRQVGVFTFINDATIGGYIILGREQYKYQEEPADIAMDGRTLETNIFRFELSNEEDYLRAKFRAANLEWPT
jgi:hypothetical protein